MPDLPDDHYEVNLSVFDGDGLTRGAMGYFARRTGADGLNHYEREEHHRQKAWARLDKKQEAEILRNADSTPIPCTHYPECPTELCKDVVAARKAAEEQYRKTIAEIEAEAEAENAPILKKLSPPNGPTTLKAKSAATALSQPKASVPTTRAAPKSNLSSAKPRLNTSLTSRPKELAAPTNPSPMRHQAAVAASKTTLGYAKGRSTSASLRKTVLPKKDPESPDTSLPSDVYIERYGVPRLGSDMWIRCNLDGCFDEGPSLEESLAGDRPGGLEALLREEAEQEFRLTF